MAPSFRIGLRAGLLQVGLIVLPFMVGVAAAQAPKAVDDDASKPNSMPDKNATQEPTAKTNSNTTAPGVSTNGVFVNGTLAVPGAAANTETTPAKFSAQNDADDKIPIMARGPRLNDEQKRQIFAAVRQARVSTADVKAVPTSELAADVELRDWPSGVTGNIPAVNGTKYVLLVDKILIVQPSNRVVVGEIAP